MQELDPRFRVRAPLRCDGIGRLECAEDVDSGSRLAVRWLPLEANGDAAVKACEKLPAHPTLPRIRRTGQVGASAFVAMDFPEGRLLSTWGNEPVSPEVLVRVAAQIADALATIHGQGVFHGEMSANSVLLVGERDEKAYLWDMPLVIANRLTDRRGEERLMHQLVRTAPFLAPERARGAGASAAADVYSLGAVLCLAGGAVRPQAQTTLGVVHQVATLEWVPEVPDVFPDSLKAMVGRMLSADPDARPAAREVAEAFAHPVQAMPTLREMAAIQLPREVLEQAGVLARAAPTAPAAPPIPVAAPTPVAVEPAPSAPAPAPTPLDPPQAAQPEVALTDNLSVSHDLAHAGAQTLSPEEAAKVSLRRRVPLAGMVAVAVGAALLAALTMVAVSAARGSKAAPLPAPTSAVAAPAAVAEPLPAQPLSAPVLNLRADTIEEELAPLLGAARSPAKAVRRARAPAAPVTRPSEVTADQFDFLEQTPAAPAAEELKRPSF